MRLQVEELCVDLGRGASSRRVVDRLGFTLADGECLGLVGESGSGKSQTALALMGLSPEGARLGGRLLLAGEDLLQATPARRRALRGAGIAMVFQDPLSALNPYLTIGLQLAEAVESQRGATRALALQEAERMLDAVGITAARRRLSQYPHELSGGMRQRVMIAMALLARPQVLIADEPTTALDPTLQRQILDLLARLRRELGLAVLLITHDLGVVAESADRVAVLYAGQLVEAGRVERVLARPRHPYTQALLDARPSRASRPGTPLRSLPGSLPLAGEAIAGCRFAPRCAHARHDCGSREPGWQAAADGGWRCHHPLPVIGPH